MKTPNGECLAMEWWFTVYPDLDDHIGVTFVSDSAVFSVGIQDFS